MDPGDSYATAEGYHYFIFLLVLRLFFFLLQLKIFCTAFLSSVSHSSQVRGKSGVILPGDFG